jgi:hypothetical protein
MAPQPLRVHLDAEAVTGIETRLWIGRKYCEHILVCKIEPHAKIEKATDGTTYVFRTEDFRTLDAGKPHIIFTLRPKTLRTLNGQLRLTDRGEVVNFIQFVYP